MGNEWFYSRQGTKSGPITAQQVKALAASGHICPSDLLWRPGLAAWVRAERFKGLFSEKMQKVEVAPPIELPPRPASQAQAVVFQATPPTDADSEETPAEVIKPGVNVPGDQATSTVATVPDIEATRAEEVRASPDQVPIDGSKTVRTLEMAEADRTNLTTIALPTAYRELGQHLHTSGTYAADFPDLYRHLNHLLNSLASFASGNGHSHAPADVEAKAVIAGHRIRTPAQHQSLKLRIDQVLEQLGEAAFIKYGDASAPAEIIQRVTQARSQIAGLDIEIAGFPKPKKGSILSVKKLLYGGLFAVLLVLIVLVFVFGKTARAGIGP